eukprot:m.361021 g.361021  ORF g.361021 m.361021 type:complete len:306 (+) comp19275_c0_seq1:329-1246(+)
MLIAPTPFRKLILFLETLWDMKMSLSLIVLYNIALYLVLRAYDDLSLKQEVVDVGFLATLGVGLTFFINFGNNQAYARWWEARQLWGGIVNRSRTIPAALEGVAKPGKVIPEEVKKDICQRHICYIRMVMHQLRQDELPATAGAYLLPEDQHVLDDPNPANTLLEIQNRKINQLHQDDLIDQMAMIYLLQCTQQFHDLQGASERIKGTPFPPTYFIFLRFVVSCFIVLMPLEMKTENGWVGIIASILVSICYLAMVQFGEDLADPFEGKPNDCAMLAVCETIQADVLGPHFRRQKHKNSSKTCIM